MPLNSPISDHRPSAILLFLVALCLVLLASGAHGGPIAASVRAAAELTALPFLTTFKYFEDGLRYGKGFVFDYNAIREENRGLQRDLTVLLGRESKREEAARQNERLRAMLALQSRTPELTLQAAEVIKSFEGTLTIDRGTLHGLRESMCVVNADGIVGMIAQAGTFTSKVLTLQNTECQIDAMIRDKRIRGKVRGTGNDLTTVCVMEYIDLNAEIVPGDLVVTSPDSVFPAGYPIGRVTHVEEELGPLSRSAEVQPAADPFRADEVFVVVRSDTGWRDLAGELLKTDQSGPILLDTKSIQERFAP